jgi:hypothetical protein
MGSNNKGKAVRERNEQPDMQLEPDRQNSSGTVDAKPSCCTTVACESTENLLASVTAGTSATN